MTEPIIMWRTRWDDRIAKVECSKVTEKSVWLLTNLCSMQHNLAKPIREARTAPHHSYHETWEDAHAYLMARAEKKLENARFQLQAAQGHYGNIKGMKKPAEEVE